jgi:cytochrome c oxidase cbb3-type subunit 3
VSATEPTPTPPAAPGAVRAGAEEPLFEHAYDGIQEYDNPMPRWWVWIFWATIVYSAVYLLNVVPLVGEGRGRIAQYEDDVAVAGRKYASARGPRSAPDDDALRALAADAGAREGGRALYMTNCMPCHRADGGGVIGPNLTDDFWIHGGTPGEIHRTISAGVLDKGMPAWGQVLAPGDVDKVTAYVISVHGTHPPDPKPPQGEALVGIRP